MIRIAVIGCGKISENHFKSIDIFSKKLKLVSVCDNNIDLAKRLGEKWKVPFYSNLVEMLTKEAPDFLVICTPSGLHLEHALIASKFGTNVITEKPMALNLKDARKMKDVFSKKKLLLFVVKQNRFNPTLLLLKKAIDEKRFGKLYMTLTNVFWTRPQSYYDTGSGWRGTLSMDGGALLNQASHYVDMLHWLFGPVRNVTAVGRTHRKIEAEDTAILTLEWDSGLIGSLLVTMLTFPKNLEAGITVLGESGTVKIGGLAVNEIQHWEFNDKRDYDKDIDKATKITTDKYGFGHPQFYENLLEYLEKNSGFFIDGNEGIKSIEIISAAYDSIRKNKKITIFNK